MMFHVLCLQTENSNLIIFIFIVIVKIQGVAEVPLVQGRVN